MIITVWWEDAPNRVKPKNFGPEKLLVACIADELALPLNDVKDRIESHPLKGDSNVLRKLRDLPGLPLELSPTVVLDRDKIHGAILRWAPTRHPANRMRAICEAIRAEAPGAYDLVFLVNNMESLFDACCAARRGPPQRGKPDPLTRDAMLNAVAFGAREWRDEVRNQVLSFDCLVKRTAQRLSPTEV